jgi:hypothetical protein
MKGCTLWCQPSSSNPLAGATYPSFSKPQDSVTQGRYAMVHLTIAPHLQARGIEAVLPICAGCHSRVKSRQIDDDLSGKS